MILGRQSRGLFVPAVYSLNFNQEEFDKAVLKGETLKRETSCAEMSGVWEVKFKKYSKAKHKKLIGG